MFFAESSAFPGSWITDSNNACLASGTTCFISTAQSGSYYVRFDIVPNAIVLRYADARGTVNNRYGDVLTDPSSTACGYACIHFAQSSTVTLTAAPYEHAHFVDWTGDCTGSAPACKLKVGATPKNVTAVFDIDQHTVAATRIGSATASMGFDNQDCARAVQCEKLVYYNNTTELYAYSLPPGAKARLIPIDPPGDAIESAGVFLTVLDDSSWLVEIDDPTAPPTALTPSTQDFPDVAVGSSSPSTSIDVTNSGGGTTIRSIDVDGADEFTLDYGSCGAPPIRLDTGASCKLHVKFRPKVAGVRAGALVVHHYESTAVSTIALGGRGVTGGTTPVATAVVLEYYHAAFDHYFMTSDPVEQAALGKPPFADWQPTGRTFKAFDAAATLPDPAEPVCRFFNASFAPKSSHFYALPDACAQTLGGFPDWTLEKREAFYLDAPDAAGNCPVGTSPIYRLYNNGQGGAPNHRFVTSLDDRAAMLAKGWVAEGSGPVGVGMCAPQ